MGIGIVVWNVCVCNVVIPRDANCYTTYQMLQIVNGCLSRDMTYFKHTYYVVGNLYVNKTVPTMKEIIKELSVLYGGFVKKGGAYKPKDCIPKDKVQNLSIHVSLHSLSIKKQNIMRKIMYA